MRLLRNMIDAFTEHYLCSAVRHQPVIQEMTTSVLKVIHELSKYVEYNFLMYYPLSLCYILIEEVLIWASSLILFKSGFVLIVQASV